MRLSSARGVMEQHDGWASTAMPAIIGHNGPEEAALGGLSARIQHRCAGFIEEDAIGTPQMGAHVVDDRPEMELRGPWPLMGPRKPPKRTADPVAERAAVQVDPLPLEDFGLSVKRKMVAEFRDDDPGDEELRRQPA